MDLTLNLYVLNILIILIICSQLNYTKFELKKQDMPSSFAMES
jgi:hypothetical protein